MNFRIMVNLKFDGAFNVGAGAMGGSTADRPMLLDWRGLPVVPGSSFKGRLRHSCKQLAEGLGIETCDEPHADRMCPNGPVPGQACLVCRTFGSPQFPVAVTFSDLPLVDPDFLTRDTPPPTSLRYGVGISRRTGVAADQLLYSTEVFLPGGMITCGGEIAGTLEADSLALLAAGLNQLIAVGSGKTGGLGWCNLSYEVHTMGEDTVEEIWDPADLIARWLS